MNCTYNPVLHERGCKVIKYLGVGVIVCCSSVKVYVTPKKVHMFNNCIQINLVFLLLPELH